MPIKKEFIRGISNVIVLSFLNNFRSRIAPDPAGDGILMNEEKSVLGLATIRRNRGITLEQIADSTKISVRLLDAIERGEFRKLPGGIYNTSYIRQYAKAIDYDEAAILSVYHREMHTDGVTSREDGGNGIHPGFRPASMLGS